MLIARYGQQPATDLCSTGAAIGAVAVSWKAPSSLGRTVRARMKTAAGMAVCHQLLVLRHNSRFDPLPTRTPSCSRRRWSQRRRHRGAARGRGRSRGRAACIGGREAAARRSTSPVVRLLSRCNASHVAMHHVMWYILPAHVCGGALDETKRPAGIYRACPALHDEGPTLASQGPTVLLRRGYSLVLPNLHVIT